MLSGIRLSEIVMLLNDEPCPWKAEMCVFKVCPAGRAGWKHGVVAWRCETAQGEGKETEPVNGK